MPDVHAKLSPSSAARWLTCTASVKAIAEADLPKDEGSIYAAEGTAAHALAEIKERAIIEEWTPKRKSVALRKWRSANHTFEDHFDEMDDTTDYYLDLVLSIRAELGRTITLVEQRVKPGIPRCFGTSDTIIVGTDELVVMDYKHGRGVPVSAGDNPQTLLYAAGALDAFDGLLGDIARVRMVIVQPRVADGTTSSTIKVEQLRAWREQARRQADLALSGRGEFAPGEQACRWCPLSGQCRAQAAEIGKLDFAAEPDQLTGEQLAAALDQIPLVKLWLDAVNSSAMCRIDEVPGWKVVQTRGRRAITDSKAAITQLTDAGLKPEQVTESKLMGITKLEKILGKKRFTELLADLVETRPGSNVLASEDDPREAVDPVAQARSDFNQGSK